MPANDHQPTDTDRDIRMSADVLGQLDDEQRRLLELDLQASAAMRSQREELFQVVDALSRQHAAESLPAPSLDLRKSIETRLQGEVFRPEKPAKPVNGNPGWSRRRVVAALAVGACLLVVLAIPIVPVWKARQLAGPIVLVQEEEVALAELSSEIELNEMLESAAPEVSVRAGDFFDRGRSGVVLTDGSTSHTIADVSNDAAGVKSDYDKYSVTRGPRSFVKDDAESLSVTAPSQVAGVPVVPQPVDPGRMESKLDGLAQPLAKPPVFTGEAAAAGGYPATASSGLSVVSGATKGLVTGYEVVIPSTGGVAVGGRAAYGRNAGLAKGSEAIPSTGFAGRAAAGTLVRGERDGYGLNRGAPTTQKRRQALTAERSSEVHWRWYGDHDRRLYVTPPAEANQEQYAAIVENPFVPVSQQALSTLSIDVDTASYANVRRFLNQKQVPPANAVRIEELINYFSYDYPAPEDDKPFASHLEVTQCPWQPNHRLVRIGLQGKRMARQERPGCNLVFLLDVSGSMKDANKLPLLKQAMKLLVDQLDENDRVAIVTYASQAGVRLKSTVADKHDVIRDAINGLNANGSTNGGAGIQLAYEQALAGAIEGGVNRVILATDGDLNVGITDDDALVRLIKEKAADDVFLTVLGFGEGNLKDAKLEKLADNGNGMYAYIDNLREARKVLVEQVEGSLVTIAKDVKIKVEFNPAEVRSYRLIGYENRLMTAAEFDDDKKDAGEIGAGHSVTALYEIVPAAPPQVAAAESLKYQQPVAPAVPDEQLTDAAKTGELLTLSLRYKLPDSDESTLIEVPLLNSRKSFSEASVDFRFATAVASFGMLLRNSVHQGDTSFAAVEEIASAAIGDDEKGYRTEFLDLVRQASVFK